MWHLSKCYERGKEIVRNTGMAGEKNPVESPEYSYNYLYEA